MEWTNSALFQNMIPIGLSGFCKFGASIFLSVHFANRQNMGLPSFAPISKPISPVGQCWMCDFFWFQGVSQDLHNLVIYFWHFLGAHSQPSNCKHWSVSVSLIGMKQLSHFPKMMSSGLSGFFKFGAFVFLSVHFANRQNMGLPTLLPISKHSSPVGQCWMWIFLISRG